MCCVFNKVVIALQLFLILAHYKNFNKVAILNNINCLGRYLQVIYLLVKNIFF